MLSVAYVSTLRGITLIRGLVVGDENHTFAYYTVAMEGGISGACHGE